MASAAIAAAAAASDPLTRTHGLNIGQPTRHIGRDCRPILPGSTKSLNQPGRLPGEASENALMRDGGGEDMKGRLLEPAP
jgi:hypothetical protein